MSSHWFSSAEKQAGRIIDDLNKANLIDSTRTYDNYRNRLEIIAQSFKDAGLPSINNVTPDQANDYLSSRSLETSQTILNMERQAMQLIMHNLNGSLGKEGRLLVVKSELNQVLKSRSYTQTQVAYVAQHQAPHNALSTEIAYAAGLRAHELLTLRPIAENSPDIRPSHESKFEGRTGERYVTTGKGGLTREIQIPTELAVRLEATRLSEPREITDRTVYYTQYYAIGAGQRWSNSFSQASKRGCGWSNGAHGVRHSYAQERMNELQRNHPYTESLRIVSQEMGHFRPSITEVYLR